MPDAITLPLGMTPEAVPTTAQDLAQNETVAPPTAAAAASHIGPGTVVELPLTDIVLRPNQPRQKHDPLAHATLVQSIRVSGVRQNILVRRNPAYDPDGPEPAFFAAPYQIIAGERRYRAAKEAGLVTIPARDLGDVDEADALGIAISENRDRDDLLPLDEAEAYERLRSLHGGITHEELAERLGIAQGTVTNSLRLLRLPPAVRDLVRAGLVGKAGAIALCGLLSYPSDLSAVAHAAATQAWASRRVQEEVRTIQHKHEAERKAAEEAAAPSLPLDTLIADEAPENKPAAQVPPEVATTAKETIVLSASEWKQVSGLWQGGELQILSFPGLFWHETGPLAIVDVAGQVAAAAHVVAEEAYAESGRPFRSYAEIVGHTADYTGLKVRVGTGTGGGSPYVFDGPLVSLLAPAPDTVPVPEVDAPADADGTDLDGDEKSDDTSDDTRGVGAPPSGAPVADAPAVMGEATPAPGRPPEPGLDGPAPIVEATPPAAAPAAPTTVPGAAKGPVRITALIREDDDDLLFELGYDTYDALFEYLRAWHLSPLTRKAAKVLADAYAAENPQLIPFHSPTDAIELMLVLLCREKGFDIETLKGLPL